MERRKRLLTVAVVGLLAPGMQAAPAQAFLQCPWPGPEGGSHYQPCLSIGIQGVNQALAYAHEAAGYSISQVEAIQAFVADLEQELGQELAPLTNYLDQQLAAAEAYAEGVSGDTQALAEAMADNTLALANTIEQEVLAAAEAIAAEQCEPYAA